MFIFNRTSTARPEHLLDAISFAVEGAAIATRLTGRPMSVFETRFGQPRGTIVWSARFTTIEEYYDFSNKLMAEPDYLALGARGGLYFSSAPQDALVSIVSSSLAAEPRRFYTTVRAVAKSNNLAEAVAFGVKTQDFVSKATGLPTAFGTSVFGPYGEMGWLTGAHSAAELDALHTFITNDPGYHALVSEASELFVEHSGVNTLIQQIN